MALRSQDSGRHSMYLATALQGELLADAANASMKRFGVVPTPDNYMLWYEYHAGNNAVLRGTMDVFASNGTGFDDNVLHDLHETFISAAREAEIIRDTSKSIQEALRSLIEVAQRAGSDADDFSASLTRLAARQFGDTKDSLRDLVGQLVQESHKMAGKSQSTTAEIRDSSEKIETLERNLAKALAEARTDGLTGAANRKAFDSTIRRLAGDAMNSGDELALLMVDADRFKRVNDTWGHQVGDEVLRHIAATLKRSVRGQDFVARYGGEEFAVLLPFTNTESAMSVAENVRMALLRDPLQLQLTPPMNPLTVSIGVASYEPGDPLAEWIGRADAALYKAKQEGRDRVRCA